MSESSQAKLPLPPEEELFVREGECTVCYAFDIGFSVDLTRCEQIITKAKERTKLRHNRRAPQYLDFSPNPLAITQSIVPFNVGAYCLRDTVDLIVFDFGAVSVRYTVPLHGTLGSLRDLSSALYENEALHQDARSRVTGLFTEVAEAIQKPKMSGLYEYYSIFNVRGFTPDYSPPELMTRFAETVSQIIRSEDSRFSQDEIDDALACRISYGPDDHLVVDWSGAFLLGRDMQDIVAVLEYGNVELLELRYLDQELDEALERAYQALSRGKRIGADLALVTQLQMDAAMMFEGVNNALKLLGDQYLARVYSLITKRFHLGDWDASILRKLDTLDNIYEKLSDRAAQRRAEALELVIIVLILTEILLPLGQLF